MEFKNKKSIYLQIADYIAESILRQEWQTNEKIPSIREIAALLEVNPNTVTRTYAHLESHGIIKTHRGIGYFVTDEALPMILHLKKEHFFRDALPELFRMVRLLNIDFNEIVALYKNERNNDE